MKSAKQEWIEKGAARATRPWWQWAGCVVATIAFLIALRLVLSGGVIPPMEARIVDAMTGEPIRGVSITLEISKTVGLSEHTDVIHSATSGQSGWFFLKGWIHFPGILFQDLDSSWLAVNEGYGDSGRPGNGVRIDVSPKSDQGVAGTNAQYFPVAVTFQRRVCKGAWMATCVRKAFPWGITIPLIPILEDVNACKKIRDSELAENCRQLNTYRDAFLEMGPTDEQWKRAQELCIAVDQGGPVARGCLYVLPHYSATESVHRDRPTYLVMFTDGVGEVRKSRQECQETGPNSGIVRCFATYGPDPSIPLVGVMVDAPLTYEQKKKAMVQVPKFTDYKQATITDVKRGSNTIRMYRGPQVTEFYWTSDEKYVRLIFYGSRPEEEKFVESFLDEFPQTDD
jgi:hypothetical protein